MTPRTPDEKVVVEFYNLAFNQHQPKAASDRYIGRVYVMDLFRVEHGKIVEHWDVIQPVPAKTANGNTMFEGTKSN